MSRGSAAAGTPYQDSTPEEMRDALLAVTDPAELHALVHAICSRSDLVAAVVPDPDFGERRLTAYVPAARQRVRSTPAHRPAGAGPALPGSAS